MLVQAVLVKTVLHTYVLKLKFKIVLTLTSESLDLQKNVFCHIMSNWGMILPFASSHNYYVNDTQNATYAQLVAITVFKHQ